MGTRFEIVLHGEDSVELRAAGEAAISRIEEAHRSFSRFDSDSLIAHLRRTAPAAVPVDQASLTMLEALEMVRSDTGGAFDPFYRASAAGSWPTIDRSRGTIAFESPSSDPDFGGCAKGFAVDWAVAVLCEAGVSQAFVQGGTSSIYGLGAPPGQPGWLVALGNRPEDPVVCLNNQGLACSATMTTRDGRTGRHLVDPRTGTTVTADRRAVVIGPTAGLADAWSTAAAVLGGRSRAMSNEWTLWIREEENTWQLRTIAD